MRIIFIFAITFFPLYAFELSVKSAKADNQNYSILNLQSQEFAFTCTEDIDEFMNVKRITCSVPRGYHEQLNEVKHPMFQLDFQKTKVNFDLHITSNYKLKLFATSKPFYKQQQLQYFDKNSSKNWTVIAYEKDIPFITVQKTEGMNFPIPRDFDSLPAVGAVDINSLPVTKSAKGDIDQYLRLEETFQNQDYEEALKIARQLQQQYTDSIFMSDFIRYEIKSMAKLGTEEHFDDIVNLSKQFIRNFSSDEFLTEVLLITAKTYAKTGFGDDAKYFYERLIKEHSGSYFGDLGAISYGEYIYDGGDKDAGIDMILDIFYSTKDLEVATIAADTLAQLYIDEKNTADAKRYIKTIWDNNPNYLEDKREKKLEYADAMAQEGGDLEVALQIYQNLLENMNKLEDDGYEDVLYKIATTYEKLQEYAKAYEAYERYLSQYSYGLYEEQANEALDMLLLKQEGVGTQEQLEQLDSLIEGQLDKSVGQKAVVAKLELLYDQNEYAKALEMDPLLSELADADLTKAKEIMQKVFDAHLQKLLQEQNCVAFDSVLQEYEYEIDAQKFDNVALFDCYMNAARFEEAKAIAQANSSSGDTTQRAQWLCRLAKVNMRQNEYGIAKDILQDVIALGAAQACEEFYYDLFEVNKQLQHSEGMIEAVESVEQEYEKDAMLLQLYRDLIAAVADTQIKSIYIKRMLALQEQLDTKLYSPWIELQGARYLESSQELAQQLQDALDASSGEDKARLYFELGNTYSELEEDEKALESYDGCIAIESMWQNLCEDAKTFIEQEQ
ncbi:MAG: tetratricopeptide repeat protein [Campylobacterota bacterium]